MEIVDDDKTLCRICLRKRKNLINIFEYTKSNKSIPTLLFENINIKVRKDDGLPPNLCSVCLNKLYSVIAFKTMAIESDKKLQKRHHNNQEVDNCKVKKEDITFDEAECIQNVNDEWQKRSIAVEECPHEEKIESGDDKMELKEMCINTNTIEKNCSEDSDHNDLILQEELKDDDYHRGSEEEGYIKSEATNIIKPQNKHVYLTKKERNSKVVYCNECKRTFGYRYYFEIHVRRHLGDTPFKCETCGKGFVRQFQLNIHKAFHSDKRPFSCNECGTSFKTNWALQSHLNVHSDHKPYQCEQCGKSFKNVYNLRAHKIRHGNVKHFVCEVCGKAFVDKRGLQSHNITHRTEADVPCPECGKMFRGKRSMQDHLRLSHSKKKRHICDYCGRGFSRKRVMDNHVRIHTGEKPFTCKVCSKSFRQLTVLTLHMRTHTGETPYACRLCPSKFKYSHLLQNHMKVHVEKERERTEEIK